MALLYLLDTNICIYIAKKSSQNILDKFSKLAPGEVAMSQITYGELLYGAEKSNNRKKILDYVAQLTNYIPVMPMALDTSHHYAMIRAMLEKKGKIIGNNDIWIAAHALSLDVTLVTNNVKEFSRVPKLQVENWL